MSWFPHDSSASMDQHILLVRSKYGSAGYGMFWMILEAMYETADATLDATALPGLSVRMNEPAETVLGLIDFCIEIGLFIKDGDRLYSERLVAEKTLALERSQAQKQRAERRWEKVRRKQNDATAMPRQCHGNAPTHPHNKQSIASMTTQQTIRESKQQQRKLPYHLVPLSVWTIARGFTFDNSEQLSAHIKRFVDASTGLKGYSPEQVLRAFYNAVEDSKDEYDVQLETVGKKIAAYKDVPVPQRWTQDYEQCLAYFTKHKDEILSTTSPLLCSR